MRPEIYSPSGPISSITESFIIKYGLGNSHVYFYGRKLTTVFIFHFFLIIFDTVNCPFSDLIMTQILGVLCELTYNSQK